jgi:hypothetical protein
MVGVTGSIPVAPTISGQPADCRLHRGPPSGPFAAAFATGSNGWRMATISPPFFQVEFDSTKFSMRRCSHGSCLANSRSALRASWRRRMPHPGSADRRLTQGDLLHQFSARRATVSASGHRWSGRCGHLERFPFEWNWYFALRCHPRESGDPVTTGAAEYWIPAFAGMTPRGPSEQFNTTGIRSRPFTIVLEGLPGRRRPRPSSVMPKRHPGRRTERARSGHQARMISPYFLPSTIWLMV